MITFFTIPKPFDGHSNVIQRNAIKSWTLLSKECEIILFTDDPGAKEIAQEFGVKCVKTGKKTEYGTPCIDDVFLNAQAIAENNILCFINTDIILLSDFLDTARRIGQVFDNFLLVGRRIDLDVTEPINFHDQWESEMLERTKKDGKLQPNTLIDYFLFNKGLWQSIPPFAIGRTVWDNWLIYEARRQKAAVIDATCCIHAIHQNHDYSHIKNGKTGAWKGPEAQQNLKLAEGYRHCFNIGDSNFFLTKNKKLMPTILKFHLLRRLIVWMILKPRLMAFIDMFYKRKRKVKNITVN